MLGKRHLRVLDVQGRTVALKLSQASPLELHWLVKLLQLLCSSKMSTLSDTALARHNTKVRVLGHLLDLNVGSVLIGLSIVI